MQMTKKTGLTTFALVLLITSAIDSIRNLPATALFGSSLIFFFTFSAIVFLIPAALVSAELSSFRHDKAGIYEWVKLALGEKAALLAVWLQWINTMVWFPSILSFLAGTATYFIDPALAQSKTYLVTVILSVFWTLTFLNLKGIHTSAKFVNVCTSLGMIIPMALIITLAIVWVVSGQPLQIHFTSSSMLPSLSHMDNWISLTAIMTAFLGTELATVHIKAVNNPQQTFPKALYFSVLLILTTMILGSLAIALVLPQNQIDLVDGVMQAFTNFFAHYHMTWLIPVITAMILIGSLGSMVSWIISPAKGLLQAAESGYLPPFLLKQNQNGVASNLLIVQAILVSIVCMAFALMPSVNGSYWLLTALSTQLYMLMYVFMFVAAIILKYKLASQPRAFTIPGKNLGMWFVCLLGLVGCAITLAVGFIPPTGIDVGTTLHYELMFIGGMVGMISPVLFCYLYKNKVSVEGLIKNGQRSKLAAEAAK
ncbi:MAG: amino acid permease [Gammaproteobacteria bacterium]|nr:MAG: amino acid permease [Gammaproteobacteria bacterium]